MAIPVVVSTNPVSGATNVTVDVTLSFAFNTTLLASSVNPATVLVYKDETAEPVKGRIWLSNDLKTISFLPLRTLVENVAYRMAVVGSADNMPGGNIKGSDGVDMPTTYQVSFRTKVERYVPLPEVTERDDYERVGPIREDDAGGQVTGYLDILMTTPRGFESNVGRCLSEIKVLFDEEVLPTGDETALELTIKNVLGMDEYYGEGTGSPPDPSGRYLQDWLPTGDPRQALFGEEVQPSGMVSFSGQYVIWTRHTGSPCFHYNTEIVVKVNSDSIVSPTGHMLAEDTYFSFTTEYWPLYVGVEYIRLMLGRSVANLFDDTIRRHIHMASIDAIDQAGGCFNFEHPYPAVRRYVRALAIINILGEMGILPALQSGRKRLGDLDIQYSPVDFAKLVVAYKNAEADKQKAWWELRAYRRQSIPMAVIKGSEWPYERGDFRMRTWQHLRNSFREIANSKIERRAKSVMGYDHPSVNPEVAWIGWYNDDRLEGFAFPWWL